MSILVTGGCGYIGSHIVIELIKQQYDVVVVDNFSNSDITVIQRMNIIANKNISFYKVDLRNKDELRKIFEQKNINCVIHLAGFKSVSESVINPLKYYDNNINSSLSLLEIMYEYGCNKIIFSSSATVYCTSNKPLTFSETDLLKCTNPYGRTKLFIEEILTDAVKSNEKLSVIILRYFNPIGSGYPGLWDNPKIPNNLMPYIIGVINGKYPHLNIYGKDYKTRDGTGERDYIHIHDLVNGHIEALKHIKPGIDSFNLGTGKGTTVLEFVAICEEVFNCSIPIKYEKQRNGDVDICVANCEKIYNKWNWKTRFTIRDGIKSCKFLQEYK